MVGVIYDTDEGGANQSFCSAAVSADPGRLVAKGTITTLEATDAMWQRLPMPPTQLKAGTYWIGALFEADVTCYSLTAPDGGAPSIGPGSKDAYAARTFASGPGTGSDLSWTHGQGGFAVYATTTA